MESHKKFNDMTELNAMVAECVDKLTILSVGIRIAKNLSFLKILKEAQVELLFELEESTYWKGNFWSIPSGEIPEEKLLEKSRWNRTKVFYVKLSGLLKAALETQSPSSILALRRLPIPDTMTKEKLRNIKIKIDRAIEIFYTAILDPLRKERVKNRKEIQLFVEKELADLHDHLTEECRIRFRNFFRAKNQYRTAKENLERIDTLVRLEDMVKNSDMIGVEHDYNKIADARKAVEVASAQLKQEENALIEGELNLALDLYEDIAKPTLDQYLDNKARRLAATLPDQILEIKGLSKEKLRQQEIQKIGRKLSDHFLKNSSFSIKPLKESKKAAMAGSARLASAGDSKGAAAGTASTASPARSGTFSEAAKSAQSGAGMASASSRRDLESKETTVSAASLGAGGRLFGLESFISEMSEKNPRLAAELDAVLLKAYQSQIGASAGAAEIGLTSSHSASSGIDDALLAAAEREQAESGVGASAGMGLASAYYHSVSLGRSGTFSVAPKREQAGGGAGAGAERKRGGPGGASSSRNS